MAGEIEYPAVPLAAGDGALTGVVQVDPRTGGTVATVAGRAFATRPKSGLRRPLDESFLEVRKALRRAGYRLQTCGACQHFRYTATSRAMSAGLSGYCGLGQREPGLASMGPAGPDAVAAPVVTLYFGCPDWVGRDERALAKFFAREQG